MTVAGEPPDDVAFVVVGRNEGDRLERCLTSIPRPSRVVYCDSGSGDGSPELARRWGVEVLELSPDRPFTAARGRNEGFHHLQTAGRRPAPPFVMFLDGDTELLPAWVDAARALLEAEPDVAMVAGRIREREAHRTIYNRLCQIEWDTMNRNAKTVGGNAMARVEAFKSVGGFDEGLIAGEEPDLCFRLRRAGWSIRHLSTDMVIHDASLLRFAQWWQRQKRAGFAYADGNARHHRHPDRFGRAEVRRNWLMGVAVPATAVGLAPVTLGTSLALLGAYPLAAARAFVREQRRGLSPQDAAIYAGFTSLSRFPETQGQLLYHWRRLQGRRQELIEHKRSR